MCEERMIATYVFRCLTTMSNISRWFLGNLCINWWTSFIRCCRASCSAISIKLYLARKQTVNYSASDTYLPRLWTNDETEMSSAAHLGSLNNASVHLLSSYFLTHPSFAHHWKTSIYPFQSFFCLVPCSITSLSLYSHRRFGTDPESSESGYVLANNIQIYNQLA